jgi:membrane-bound metal-dependent hydrolase YbcI (DUF457 family)
MYYDHALLGAAAAVAAGARRRHGWPLVATAAVAAMLPDWDDLSMLLGPDVRRAVHRVWGHNLLVALLSAGLLGAVGYLCFRAARGRRSAGDLAVWVAVAMLAALTHLLADVVYSKETGAASWPVAFFWPFSHRGWAVPVLTTADHVGTAILLAGLLAALRWPAASRLLAGFTLAAVAGYVGLRAVLDGALVAGAF